MFSTPFCKVKARLGVHNRFVPDKFSLTFALTPRSCIRSVCLSVLYLQSKIISSTVISQFIPTHSLSFPVCPLSFLFSPNLLQTFNLFYTTTPSSHTPSSNSYSSNEYTSLIFTILSSPRVYSSFCVGIVSMVSAVNVGYWYHLPNSIVPPFSTTFSLAKASCLAQFYN